MKERPLNYNMACIQQDMDRILTSLDRLRLEDKDYRKNMATAVMEIKKCIEFLAGLEKKINDALFEDLTNPFK
jgi:hypothetical protein